MTVAGTQEYRWGWLPAIIISVPYVIWAMNRSNFGDTETYRCIFYGAPSSVGQIASCLAEHAKDKGFSVFTILLKSIIGNSDKIFFLIIAAIQIFCVVYFFRKYSYNFLMSMFMFVASTDYLSWVFNGMRQFLAVCIVLFSFEFVLKKKYVPAVVLILIASTIHGSALIMLPIIFVVQGKAWNKRTVFTALVFVIGIVFIDRFTSILDTLLTETQYSDMITNEIWTTDDGTNIFRILFYSIPAIMSLIWKKHIDAGNNKQINMFVNCTAITAFLYAISGVSSGIYVGRLPIYTTLAGYVAVPWMIDHIFTESSARIVKMGFVLVYLVFFYFQMHMAWEII